MKTMLVVGALFAAAYLVIISAHGVVFITDGEVHSLKGIALCGGVGISITMLWVIPLWLKFG